MAEFSDTSPPMRRTPLHDLHRSLGARVVAFAGYEMPVQYAGGIIAEHLHTRAKAGLFDVSHMGQIALRGDSAARALEKLVPGDLRGLAPGGMRYTLLLNDSGGILDDLMATRIDDGLMLVVNAARKEADLDHLRRHLGPDIPGPDTRASGVTIEPRFDRALLALQGPMAAAVLARLSDAGVARMNFMSATEMRVAGAPCFVTRSGYTGEDGFELSLAADDAALVAEALLREPEVAPVGLGARDTLRLEAGLCLYGHDIDETTTPVEAGLVWTIAKRRREAGDFPGAATILRQLDEGPLRKRVGIRLDGRAPAREGTAITDANGHPIGRVTSGGFGPSVGAPIAMGYVDSGHAAEGAALALVVRDVPRPARVARLPFLPARYYRG